MAKDIVTKTYESRKPDGADRPPWVHPIARSLRTPRKGPFVPLSNGDLLTIDDKLLVRSHDDGETWGEALSAEHGQAADAPSLCSLMETEPGTLVMIFLDSSSRQGSFDVVKGFSPDSRYELHSIRSLDGGKTWIDRQTILGGQNANFFGCIKTGCGRLVVVAEHLLEDHSRWVSCSLVSDDGGRSWQRGNFIDLGGCGHHDGALEPTVAEMKNGRLMMLLRTNLGFLWQAFSDDGGHYWRTIRPTTIDASSSPAQLLRLASGRWVLVWNRRNPENAEWPLTKPGNQFSETDASWHREELSIAVSDNDGDSWSQPLVIAKLPGGQLSYPHVLERRPGEVWGVAGIASSKWFNEAPISFGVSLRESDLLDAVGHSRFYGQQ